MSDTPRVEPKPTDGPLPLAAASRRLRDIARGKVTSDPVLCDRVAALASAGLTQQAIGDAVGIAQGTVGTMLRNPHVQIAIQAHRDVIREKSLERIATRQTDIYDWLDSVIGERDSKGFKNITVGIRALEQTAASAAGDARRVEHAGSVDMGDPAEGRRLLLALLG